MVCVLHASTKHAEFSNAIAILPHPNITLVSLMTMDEICDVHLMQDWTRHYQTFVKQMKVYVRLDPEETLNCRPQAKTFHIVRSRASDAFKLHIMNSALASIREGDAMIYADADEMHEFACGMQSLPTCIIGIMWDQIPIPHSQFDHKTFDSANYKLQCRIRSSIPRMMSYKTLFVTKRRGVIWRNTHSVNSNCLRLGLSRHFTAYNMGKHIWKKKQITLTDRNWANGTCGNFKDGICQDNQLLYDRITAVLKNDLRYPSHLCPFRYPY